MTDFLVQAHGVFPNGRKWSIGRYVTSGQPLGTLLNTWTNAFTAGWNDAVNGLKLAYPVGTVVTGFTVRQLGAKMREVNAVGNTVNLPGTNANNSLPANVSVVMSWSYSGGIGKTTRGHNSMPAPAENEVVNDKVVPGTAALFTAAWNIIKAGITADGSNFFVFPRSDTLSGIPAYTKQPVDTVKTRDVVGRSWRRIKKEPPSYV